MKAHEKCCLKIIAQMIQKKKKEKQTTEMKIC